MGKKLNEVASMYLWYLKSKIYSYMYFYTGSYIEEFKYTRQCREVVWRISTYLLYVRLVAFRCHASVDEETKSVRILRIKAAFCE